MKPTLFLLAAGMGSRYGGLKQLDGLGPNGETIMDYSIYDAIRAGFGKLVFVIRKDFEQDFRDKILSKYESHIPCELVFQALDNLPEGFTCPAERTKPWGTNHAVMMGADVIKEPFAVINCDDFYGRDSFQTMGKFLAALPEGSKNVYSMVGFRVGNTLSESGTVSRGICSTDANKLLTSVVERTKIQRIDGEVKYIDDNGEWTATPDTTPVSMNFWGFTPDYFAYSQEFFKTFLSDPKNMENLKSEFFIPLMVDKLINDKTATVEVLDTASKWFGVTYPEDRQEVVDKIQALFTSVEDRDAARKEIEEVPGIEITGALPMNLEINAAGVNKGKAMIELGKLLGIPREEIMAFGDGNNDLKMLKEVGTGVAMENAIPSVKEAADYVTLSNDEEGVAKFIEKYMLD